MAFDSAKTGVTLNLFDQNSSQNAPETDVLELLWKHLDSDRNLDVDLGPVTDDERYVDGPGGLVADTCNIFSDHKPNRQVISDVPQGFAVKTPPRIAVRSEPTAYSDARAKNQSILDAPPGFAVKTRTVPSDPETNYQSILDAPRGFTVKTPPVHSVPKTNIQNISNAHPSFSVEAPSVCSDPKTKYQSVFYAPLGFSVETPGDHSNSETYYQGLFDACPGFSIKTRSFYPYPNANYQNSAMAAATFAFETQNLLEKAATDPKTKGQTPADSPLSSAAKAVLGRKRGRPRKDTNNIDNPSFAFGSRNKELFADSSRSSALKALAQKPGRLRNHSNNTYNPSFASQTQTEKIVAESRVASSVKAAARKRATPEKKTYYRCPKCHRKFTTTQTYASHFSIHYKYESPAERRERRAAKRRKGKLLVIESINGMTAVAPSKDKKDSTCVRRPPVDTDKGKTVSQTNKNKQLPLGVAIKQE